MVFLKTRPLWSGTTQNLQMYPVSLHSLCAAHTLHCPAGYFLFPSPPPTIFSSLCILKSRESLPGGSCLGPIGVSFSGNWRSSELDSLQFWTSDIQDHRTSCRKFVYFTFLFVFSVLYTKNASKSAQFNRYSTTFFKHFTVSSELSNNWGTGLPCLTPSWIYCTGLQHKASLFPCLFSCLSSPCLRLLHHGSYLSLTQVFCPSALAPLHHLSSGTMTVLFSSVCIRILGDVECPCLPS